MDGKIVAVTGANAGLGKAIALALAKQGARVLMLCRDKTRGAAARTEIQAATGNKNIELILMDLASLQSVRAAAAEIRQKYEHLDALVNNAGVFKNTRVLSADGLEMMFATNHLGPFLLTNLLLDTLKGGRIINVTAPSTTKLNFEDLQAEKNFGSLSAFGASKMCNLLFTYELSRRIDHHITTVNALHPGLVKSDLMHEAFFLIRFITNLMSVSPDKAAEDALYVISSPEVEGVSGKFFKGRKTIESSAYSHDPAVQRLLWEVSARLAGMNEAAS